MPHTNWPSDTSVAPSLPIAGGAAEGAPVGSVLMGGGATRAACRRARSSLVRSSSDVSANRSVGSWKSLCKVVVRLC